ncbi:MAG: 1-acyl-sn-glycerol-3-phosphate acyltransferase [Halioglobus sp.]
MTDPFADIRPYRDEEVSPVLERLLSDPEFLTALGRLRFPRAAGLLPWLIKPLVKRFLMKELRDVNDVQSMQQVIGRYMDRMISSTTAGLSVSGLDGLAPDQAYLFISNHRDIAMDPAFTNYALYLEGRNTVRIAIGDNLLTTPWVSDLMRLNKSFIVKRSVSGPRELLAVSKNLSNYIKHSLVDECAPIWIAQREGRAKDGIDRTEPAIIKMLAMSRDKKTEQFADHIGGLKIVPVAISYELDPCDGLKAAELYQLASEGHYQKGEQEDVASIAQGIAGGKGAVHVSFGTPLDASLDTPEAVATEIDRQVSQLYCLHLTNIYAHKILHGEDVAIPGDVFLEQGSCSQEHFEARINAMPEAHRPYALAIYANALSASQLPPTGSPELAD